MTWPVTFKWTRGYESGRDLWMQPRNYHLIVASGSGRTTTANALEQAQSTKALPGGVPSTAG